MNEAAAIWNLLHDGGIDRVERDVLGQVTLGISIQYLTEQMGLGDEGLVLRLENCREFVYREYVPGGEGYLPPGDPTGCEILSTDSEQTPYEIALCSGTIIADFDGFTLRDSRDSEITFERLSNASRDYWDEWETRPRE